MNRTKSTVIVFASFMVLLVIALAVTYYHSWQPWIAYHTGSANGLESNGEYAFFSGSGSDITELGIIVALASLIYHTIKKNNCHTEGCWRIGSMPVGDYKVCRRHHHEATGTKVDIEHLKVHHHLAKRKRLLDAGYNTSDGTDSKGRDFT